MSTATNGFTPATVKTTTTTTKTTTTKPKFSIWLQIQSLMNTINHTLIGLIAVYITALGRSLNFKDTAMHAFMTIIGFHVLAAEALMSHYHVNPITRRFSHRTKSKIHSILQLVGGSMGLLGALGKMSQTEVHFTTLHGKIGLAATFLCFASIVGGIVNYFQPKFVHKYISPSELKFRHNLFGMVTFTLAMTTIFLGYRTKFFYKYADPEFIAAISLATILVYIFTMISPMASLLDKLKYRNKHRK